MIYYGLSRAFQLHTKTFIRILHTKTHGNLWQRLRRKMGFLEVSKTKLNYAALKIYCCCTDEVDHHNLIKQFSMPDTFFSWFLITELHVWMSLVRAMEEGDEGRCLRNYIVEHLWKDTETRSKVLGPMTASIRRSSLQEFSDQFQAAMFAYDEGLLFHDRILASALWRIFFLKNCDDPEKIEMLVSYVRRSILHLESLERNHFLIDGIFSWPPIMESRKIMS